MHICLWFSLGDLPETTGTFFGTVIVCNGYIGCEDNETIEFEKCENNNFIFKLKRLYSCGAYCVGKMLLPPTISP